MVKLIFLCRRRPDITHERYAELLLSGHVPIALQHHPAMRRYVVNIVEHTPDGWDVLDSVGELSFDTVEDFRERLYDSPAGKVVLERDVAGFMGGADAFATTEHVQRRSSVAAVFGVRAAGIKLVCPVVRCDGMSHADFVDHWKCRRASIDALGRHRAKHQGRRMMNTASQRVRVGCIKTSNKSTTGASLATSQRR